MLILRKMLTTLCCVFITATTIASQNDQTSGRKRGASIKPSQSALIKIQQEQMVAFQKEIEDHKAFCRDLSIKNDSLKLNHGNAIKKLQKQHAEALKFKDNELTAEKEACRQKYEAKKYNILQKLYATEEAHSKLLQELEKYRPLQEIAIPTAPLLTQFMEEDFDFQKETPIIGSLVEKREKKRQARHHPYL